MANPNELLELEQKILDRFRQRSLPYLKWPLVGDWDNLFLMQHSGIPTRLLDWTENPYIGLYFALTDAPLSAGARGKTAYVEDSAVWLLDPVAWNRKVLSYFSFKGTVLSPHEKELKGYSPATEVNLLNSEPVAMYGTHNSARIVAQRGVFTIFGKNTRPMEELYSRLDFPKDCLVKLVIPAKSIADLLKAITAIGITDSVVFPDIVGLAREIKRFFGYEV